MKKIFASVAFIFLFKALHGQVDGKSIDGLQKLKKNIDDAQIVGLGEEGHGYETFNHVKANVAGFLQQALKFKAIIFESSFTQCMIAYLNSYSLGERLKTSLYPFWNTASVRRVLEEFQQKEGNADTPLILGCDIQEDCRYIELSNFLINKNYINESRVSLKQCDSILSFYIGENFSKKILSKEDLFFLFEKYDQVIADLKINKSNIENSNILLRCLENRKWLCKYLSIKNVKEKMYLRDSLMADNVIWVKKFFFEYKPVILWAANTHVAKLKDKTGKPKWLGEWLSLNNRYKYYAISVGKKTFSPGKDTINENCSIRFLSEEKKIFDAMIYCKKVEKIKSEEWVTSCK